MRSIQCSIVLIGLLIASACIFSATGPTRPQQEQVAHAGYARNDNNLGHRGVLYSVLGRGSTTLLGRKVRRDQHKDELGCPRHFPLKVSQEGQLADVAVCMFGESRAPRLVAASLFQYVIEPLSAVLFVHTSLGKNPLDLGVLAANPRTVAIEATDETPDDVLDAVAVNKTAWRKLAREIPNSNWAGGLRELNNPTGGNMYAQAHLHGCRCMIKAYERIRGRPFKFIALQRSDYKWLSRHMPLSLMFPENNNNNFSSRSGSSSWRERCWIPGVGHDFGGYRDHYAFCTRQAAEAYMGWIGTLSSRHREVQQLLEAHKLENQEHNITGGAAGYNGEKLLKLRLDLDEVQVSRKPDEGFLVCKCEGGGECAHRDRSQTSQCKWTGKGDIGHKRHFEEAKITRDYLKRCGWSRAFVERYVLNPHAIQDEFNKPGLCLRERKQEMIWP